MSVDTFREMVMSLVPEAPVIAALMVGSVLALQRRGEQERYASLALAGFICLLASVVIFSPLSIWLLRSIDDRGGTAATIGIVLMVIGTVKSLIAAVGFGLLLRALLLRPIDRSGPAATGALDRRMARKPHFRSESGES